MKVLAVSTWFPCPPDNGSKIRVYNLLVHIGDRHTLDLITMSQSGRDAEYTCRLREFCRRVAVFPEPRFRPESVRSWLGFLSPVPRYFREHHCAEMEHLAARWAGEEGYDVSLAVTLGAAPYVSDLDVPRKVLDQHNVESQVIKRQWRSERSLFRRLRYAPTWAKAERFERALAGRFDAVTVVSEPEGELMRRVLGNGHGCGVHVIPNGVDARLLEYSPPEKEQTLLVFTGGLTYQPNHDAALRLCRSILPMVRARLPEAHVRITGRTGNVSTQEFAATPGVELTGYVDDIRPVVASASALVVPLRQGGGTRLKILEAMALGTPVISTPIGAEGLAVRDGVDIVIGETDEEIAEHVLRLLSDPDLSGRIARQARDLVSEHYQWPAIARDFERVLAAAV